MTITPHPQRCRNGCSKFKFVGETGFEVPTCNGEPISYREEESYSKRGCASYSNRLKGYHDVEEFYKDEKE